MQLQFHKGDRNGLLLGALIVTLVFSPYTESGSAARFIFSLMLTFVMVTGALSGAQAHGRTKLVGVVLAVALLGAFFLAQSLGSTALPIIHMLEILFLSVVGLSVLAKVLGPGAITLDQIFGAIAVYLMAGLVLGLSCELLESYEPGSFSGSFSADGVKGSDMVYFGYVTLTTLGYGDIAPVTAKARSLAMLGAIVGPLYVAILIARLVSDYGSMTVPKKATKVDGV